MREGAYFAYNRAVGRPLRRAYRDLVDRDVADFNDATQEQLLGRMLSHARRRVPYYRDVIDVAGRTATNPSDSLERLPLLTKDMIRSSLESLKSDDLGQRHWSYNSSGGSTGTPVELIQDREFWVRTTAIQLLYSTWVGRRHVGEREVLLWANDDAIAACTSSWRMKLGGRVTNRAYLSASKLTPARLGELVVQLDILRPQLIVGYAHVLYELARFVEANELDVTWRAPIISTSGRLYPFMRRKVEQAFSASVFDRYGAREVGDIAGECAAHDGLHVFPWGTYVEVVDEAGRRVEPGVEGDLVVTSLANEAMPLIRYMVGDRGVLAPSGRCACGRGGQRLERVSCRSQHALRKPNGSRLDEADVTEVVAGCDWVLRFQIRQVTPAALTVQVVASVRPEARESESVLAQLRAIVGPGCAVGLELVDAIPSSPSGKFFYAWS